MLLFVWCPLKNAVAHRIRNTIFNDTSTRYFDRGTTCSRVEIHKEKNIRGDPRTEGSLKDHRGSIERKLNNSHRRIEIHWNDCYSRSIVVVYDKSTRTFAYLWQDYILIELLCMKCYLTELRI